MVLQPLLGLKNWRGGARRPTGAVPRKEDGSARQQFQPQRKLIVGVVAVVTGGAERTILDAGLAGGQRLIPETDEVNPGVR